MNTVFKFLSRGFIIAGFLLVSTQATQAQTAPVITKFQSSTNTATVNGNWTLSWEASGAAGCLLIPSDCTGSACGGGFYNPNSQVTLDDDGVGEYSYTLQCYTEIKQRSSLNGDTTITSRYTTVVPVPISSNNEPNSSFGLFGTGKETIFPQPVVVTVVDATTLKNCDSAPDKNLCEQVCSAYKNDAASCQTCKTDATKCATFAKRCLVSGQKPANQTPSQSDTCSTNNVDQAEEQGGIDPTPKDAPDQSGGRCFPKLMGGSGFNFKGCIVDVLDVTFVPLAASFLQLSAYIFEFAIQISIVEFPKLVSSSGDWLTTIWRTIRDILNIFVIFVLLYSAINVIIGRGGEIKKLISGVILFGVLTNFSLFLTKAAVDLSNVVALEFYQQMRTAPLEEARFEGGLGSTIVGITGLTQFYSADKATAEAEAGPEFKKKTAKATPLQDSILYRGAMIIVFLAVALVFIQAAFIFIARTLSIILLLIFSPLMFAGGVFTPIKEWIDKWQKEFTGQIILAPLFMILLYVVLTVMKGLLGAVNSSLTPGSDTFSFLALIILTSALTVFGFGAALSKAREYSSSIGEKGVSKALGWGTKAAGLVGGFVGRNSVGRLGKRLLSGESATGNALRESAAKNGFMGRVFARTALKTAASASKGEFDVRGSSVGSGIGKILDASNKYTKGNIKIDAGKATTSGGFAGRLKKDTEEQTKQDVTRLKELEGLLKAEGDTRNIKYANIRRKTAFEANGGYNREIFEAIADSITGRGIRTSLVTGRATGQSVREDAIKEFKKKSKKSKNEDELKTWKKDLLRYAGAHAESPDQAFLKGEVEVGGKKISDYTSKEDLEDALEKLDEIDTKKLWQMVGDEAEKAPSTNTFKTKALGRAKAAPGQISKLAEAIDKETKNEERGKSEKEKGKNDKKDIKK